MQIRNISMWPALLLVAVSLLATANQAHSADNAWSVNGFLDNDNRYRVNKDRPHGSVVGLSKQRSTVIFGGNRAYRNGFGSLDTFNIEFGLKASYDAVHDLNAEQWGDQAGRAVCIEDTSGFIASGCVPHGQGAFGGRNLAYGPFAVFPGRLGFDINQNPNEGLILLGEPLYSRPDGGVTFGVPIRPCDVDGRGCLANYMDKDTDGLRFREFAQADRLDFIRKLTIDGSKYIDSPFSDGEDRLLFSIGRQQIIWGRTDLFRVLDVINPVDFSINNIYDELLDTRHPQWIAATEYQAGGVGIFQDLNFQVVWKFDKYRPSTLGQCGEANSIVGAGCLFRGLKNLWDNGGTVANFALNPPAVGGLLGLPGLGVGDAPPSLTTDFGPQQIGIRQVNLPSWNLANTEIGFKLEGILGPTTWSINGMLRRQDLPSLHGGLSGPPSFNPFLPVGDAEPSPYLIAFDVEFPRTKLLGGSLDFTIDKLNTIHRFELAMGWGEEVPNTLDVNLYSESRTLRYVVGVDRLTFLPFTGSERTWILSFQTFGQHFLDHELKKLEFGKAGVPWKENNWISTFLAQGYYLRDRLVPQFVVAWDYGARSGATRWRVDYFLTDALKLRAGVNWKFGGDLKRQNFHDARDTNPYPPFTAYPGASSEPGDPVGTSGFFPLAIFGAGPLGMSREEDEIFVGFSYQLF